MTEFRRASELRCEDFICLPAPGVAEQEVMVVDDAKVSDDGLWVFVTLDLPEAGPRLVTFKADETVLWVRCLPDFDDGEEE